MDAFCKNRAPFVEKNAALRQVEEEVREMRKEVRVLRVRAEGAESTTSSATALQKLLHEIDRTETSLLTNEFRGAQYQALVQKIEQETEGRR